MNAAFYPMRPSPVDVTLTTTNVVQVFRILRQTCVIQPKVNGHRVLAFVDDAGVAFYNRHGGTYTFTVANAAALATLPAATVLDGENFHQVFAPFDVVKLAGRDMRQMPVEDRVAAVKDLCARFGLPWLFDEPTEDLLAVAGANLPALEGFVAKARGSIYREQNKPFHTADAWTKWKWMAI